MSNCYRISESDSIYASDTSSEDDTFLDAGLGSENNDITSQYETVSNAGTIEPLPLYEPEPPTLPPRSIPICPHHQLNHSTLTKLHRNPRPTG